MSASTIEKFQQKMNVKEEFRSIWINSVNFYLENPRYIKFREQFEQTEMMSGINPAEFELNRFIVNLFQRGIEEKIIKHLPIPLLTTFAFIPIITLLRLHFDNILKMDDDQIAVACDIAWNAIKTDK